jgi:hypothetical protein
MTDEIDLLVDADGVHFIHDDRLVDVFDGEPQRTVRASHVEPHPTRPGWLADMRPSGGPVLGHGWERTPEAIDWSLRHHGNDGVASLPPFRTRQEALDAERAWLRRERGL